MLKTRIKMFKVANSFIRNQCYIIYKGKEGVLIDPAWEYDLINDFLIENSIHILSILLTHSHIDHTNLAEEFSRDRNIPVFMSGTEIDNYNFNLFNLKRANHFEKIMLNDFIIVPIVTPGHTLGSTCYLIDDNLFSGDTVFIEGVGICSYNNAGKLFDSVQLLKNYLPETTLFWPGHSFGEDPGKTLKYLIKHNIYFQFKNKEHFVNFRTRKNRPDIFAFK